MSELRWLYDKVRPATADFSRPVAQSSVLNFTDVCLHVSVLVLYFMMGVDMSYMPLWYVLIALTAALAYVKAV